jgi:hypothetical protein
MRRITVLFNDNYIKVVSGIELERLLVTDRVKAFRRSTGWAIVGKDPLRGKGGKYTGPERRKQSGKRCCGRFCLTCEHLIDGKCLFTTLPGVFDEADDK